MWQVSLSGLTVLVNCDNAATLSALATGKSACPVMTDVLRETWALCSLLDITILPKHKPGEQMDTPDLLSRAYKSEANWRQMLSFRDTTSLQWYPVPPAALKYPHCHWDKPRSKVVPYTHIQNSLIFHQVALDQSNHILASTSIYVAAK